MEKFQKYVLLKDEEPLKYCIVCVHDYGSTFWLIEDSEEHIKEVNKLLEEGAEVFESIDDLYKKYPPQKLK